MKIIHIFSINSGGAAIAAKRIAKAVETVADKSVSNQFLALYYAKNDPVVISYFNSPRKLFTVKAMRKISDMIFNVRSKDYPGPFSLGGFGVAQWSRLKYFLNEADIVHVHWVNRGFFSIKQLNKLVDSGKPIVWTMHDMWAFTGGCHYDGDCKKYEGVCKGCYCIKSGRRDFTHEQAAKAQIFSKGNVFIVGCSHWITACARRATIMKNQRHIQCIANPINCNFFSPVNATKSASLREKYGIPKNKRIVLFGAMSSEDKRKGSEFIHQIVGNISKKDFQLVVFGNCSDYLGYDIENATILGAITDEKSMHEIYSMSDVFIAPSIQENLANTVMESLASGTPVVAFNIGGMQDMIIDNYNGKLITPFQVDEFIKAIKFVSTNSAMRRNATTSIREQFSEDIIGQQYYHLYCEALCSNVNIQ